MTAFPRMAIKFAPIKTVNFRVFLKKGNVLGNETYQTKSKLKVEEFEKAYLNLSYYETLY